MGLIMPRHVGQRELGRKTPATLGLGQDEITTVADREILPPASLFGCAEIAARALESC
jgi:hypothetical protein